MASKTDDVNKNLRNGFSELHLLSILVQDTSDGQCVVVLESKFENVSQKVSRIHR